MRRLLIRLAVPCVLSLVFAGSAAAAVHVRIAVRPDSIPQCSVAHGILVVANDGTSPIMARLCFALGSHDSTIAGPICGRVPLAAGERRSHEFMFFIPPHARLGNYAFVARAEGSDGSSDHSIAPFTVVPSAAPCIPPPPTNADPAADMLNGAVQSIGVTPDQATPTSHSSWGSLKILYR